MSLYVGLTVAYYLSAIPIGLALGIGIPAAIEAAQLPPGVRHVLGTAASILLIVSSASFYALDWIGVATGFGLAASFLSFWILVGLIGEVTERGWHREEPKTTKNLSPRSTVGSKAGSGDRSSQSVAEFVTVQTVPTKPEASQSTAYVGGVTIAQLLGLTATICVLLAVMNHMDVAGGPAVATVMYIYVSVLVLRNI